MADPKQEWTERELCEAFHLSSQQLQRLVMEGVIPPPTRKFTRQFRYDQRHVDGLRRHMHSQDRQRYLEDLLKRWEKELDETTTVQLEVNQLLSVGRLLGGNIHQGLDELSQFDRLEPRIVVFILRELATLQPEDELLSYVILLLYEKWVPGEYKGRGSRNKNA